MSDDRTYTEGVSEGPARAPEGVAMTEFASLAAVFGAYWVVGWAYSWKLRAYASGAFA